MFVPVLFSIPFVLCSQVEIVRFMAQQITMIKEREIDDLCLRICAVRDFAPFLVREKKRANSNTKWERMRAAKNFREGNRTTNGIILFKWAILYSFVSCLLTRFAIVCRTDGNRYLCCSSHAIALQLLRVDAVRHVRHAHFRFDCMRRRMKRAQNKRRQKSRQKSNT